MVSMSLTTLGNNRIPNTFYVSFGNNIPPRSFGYPAGIDNTSINAAGVSFSAGLITYFDKDKSERTTKLGVDFVFAEMAKNFNTITKPERRLSSTLFAMKLGPVLSTELTKHLNFDIYSQGVIGLTTLSYYNNYRNLVLHLSDYTPQLGIAAGIRFGYRFIAVNFEYNWGRPSIFYHDNTIDEVHELKINQSYLRLGVSVKFSSFKQ